MQHQPEDDMLPNDDEFFDIKCPSRYPFSPSSVFRVQRSDIRHRGSPKLEMLFERSQVCCMTDLVISKANASSCCPSDIK